MIKCKNGGCPNGKDICCYDCELFGTCVGVCEEDPIKCEDAIFEGSNELEVFNNAAMVIIKNISNLVLQKKTIEEQEKQMKEKLQEAMEKYGIKKFDNDIIKVTYMEASTRNSVDSAKLKKNHPEIAAECTKTSNVKAFIKIEVK